MRPKSPLSDVGRASLPAARPAGWTRWKAGPQAAKACPTVQAHPLFCMPHYARDLGCLLRQTRSRYDVWLPAIDRNHELQCRMRGGEAGYFHVYEARLFARGEDPGLGNVFLSFGIDHPDRAVRLDRLLQGPQAIQIF